MFSTTQFSILYFCCLAFCLGSIEALKHTWAQVSDETTQDLPASESRAIAVPPKPKSDENIDKNSGDGEGKVAVYTEEGCRKMRDEYKDICFQALARQLGKTDLTGGVAACELIQMVDKKWECLSDVAEAYSTFDRDAALQVCPTIKRKKWHDQCFFGIALAYSTTDSRWAFRACDMSGQWRDYCRHDVNGEIAVVNLDLALAHCAAEEGDLLTRKTCWHGIGKYIARVDVSRAFEACQKVPLGPQNLYRENCVHGLGWGASEKKEVGASFVAQCDRAGEQKDSCLLGVAYNLKRFNLDTALSICDQVARTDLASQCVAFVNKVPSR